VAVEQGAGRDLRPVPVLHVSEFAERDLGEDDARVAAILNAPQHTVSVIVAADVGIILDDSIKIKHVLSAQETEEDTAKASRSGEDQEALLCYPATFQEAIRA